MFVEGRQGSAILVSWTRLVSRGCAGSRLNCFQQLLFSLFEFHVLIGPSGSRVQVELLYHSYQISIFCSGTTFLVFLSCNYQQLLPSKSGHQIAEILLSCRAVHFTQLQGFRYRGGGEVPHP